jgi:hypothetical protein
MDLLKSHTALDLPGALCVTGDNLDAFRVDSASVVEFEVDILDNEGPDIVAEAVGVEMALQLPKSAYSICGKSATQPTLNVIRALTLSASTSATALSKLTRIFIAS